MPNSTRSSSASARFRPRGAPDARIDWRPSRWLLGLLAVLAALAAMSLLASDLPRAFAWPAVIAVLGDAGWRLWREAHRPPRTFVFRGDASMVLVDGAAVDGMVLQWRGPLAFARWRDGDGRIHRLSWWPDTLAPARRRELRLAAPDPEAARRAASMAP